MDLVVKVSMMMGREEVLVTGLAEWEVEVLVVVFTTEMEDVVKMTMLAGLEVKELLVRLAELERKVLVVRETAVMEEMNNVITNREIDTMMEIFFHP